VGSVAPLGLKTKKKRGRVCQRTPGLRTGATIMRPVGAETAIQRRGLGTRRPLSAAGGRATLARPPWQGEPAVARPQAVPWPAAGSPPGTAGVPWPDGCQGRDGRTPCRAKS